LVFWPIKPDAMLGALQWEVNESNGHSGIPNVPGILGRLFRADRLQVCIGVLSSPGSAALKIIGRVEV
jgi:hypothetical protein